MRDLHIYATLERAEITGWKDYTFESLKELQSYLDSGNFRFIEGFFNGVHVSPKELELILDIFG